MEPTIFTEKRFKCDECGFETVLSNLNTERRDVGTIKDETAIYKTFFACKDKKMCRQRAGILK